MAVGRGVVGGVELVEHTEEVTRLRQAQAQRLHPFDQLEAGDVGLGVQAESAMRAR
ncbi:hypothetical protein [Pengzhenrongella sp.]|jgi:hypothetical protein|uniref:hypothetical protein n=1 Tax=Pengzhenrongella sp. TaxID=2888820 RepID=UPI0039C9218E